MFKCVTCGYQGTEFLAEVVGLEHGSFTYRAKCPNCRSHMVNVPPGFKEARLRIKLTK